MDFRNYSTVSCKWAISARPPKKVPLNGKEDMPVYFDGPWSLLLAYRFLKNRFASGNRDSASFTAPGVKPVINIHGDYSE